MPQEIDMVDFGSGWIPSDDPVNGRKNGFTSFDNVKLDKNGAVTSIYGGTQVGGFNWTSAGFVLDLYDSVYGLYAAFVDVLYRGPTSIYSGPNLSSLKAAFASAFNFVLIASNIVRLKDDGTNTYNLGIEDTYGVPTATVAPPNLTSLLTPPSYTIFDPTSRSSSVPTFAYTGSAATIDMFWGSSAFLDWTTLPSAGGSFASTLPQDPSDIINIQLIPGSTSLSTVISVTLTLVTGGGSGPIFAAGFQATQSSLNLGFQPATLTFKRSDFVPFNYLGYPADWSQVCGFNVSIAVSGPLDCTVGGTIVPIVDAALGTYSTHFAFYNGASNLTTSYQYIELGVNQSTNYVTMTSYLLSTPSNSVNVVPGGNVEVGINAFSDPQVNQIWLYRQGGNLGQWYRVATFINLATSYIDNFSDEDALTEDIIINLNLITTGPQGITDPIYSIVGPMSGRWFYFTPNFCYPSDINDPDLADASLAVRTCGANEVFLWALKVSEGVIFVGTNLDIYVLSGTFATLSDGSLDIYYRPLVCKYPPISMDAEYYQGAIYYLAEDGWRATNTLGQSQSLVKPSSTRLYQGEFLSGLFGNYLAPNIKNLANYNTRWPICVQNGQVYCGMQTDIHNNQLKRIEVFDIDRNYWRVITFPEDFDTCTALAKGLGGNPYAAYIFNDALIRGPVQLEQFGTGVTSLVPPINLVTPYFPHNKYNRRDYYTVKMRLYSGGALVTIVAYFEDGSSCIGFANTSTEQTVMISFTNSRNPSVPPINKLTFLQITGTPQSASLPIIISGIAIDSEERPSAVTDLIIRPENFGSYSEKRLRVWPIIIDTLGSAVDVFGMTTSGLAQIATINTTDKTTVPIYFTTDVFKIDYGLRLRAPSSGNADSPVVPFEFYGAMPPNVVQTLPPSNEFDQIGPMELFRYSSIQLMDLRIFSFTGGTLTYTIFYDDIPSVTGTAVITPNVENTINITLPKGTSGTIPRVTLGPSGFVFYRYYTRIKAVLKGRDATDAASWITLPGNVDLLGQISS